VAEKYNMVYVESSAKRNINIDKIFEISALQVLMNIHLNQG
jgi:hypothetical protein